MYWGPQRTHGDAILVPFHRKNTSTLSIKIRPIRRSTPLDNTTPSIIIYQAIAISVILPIYILSSSDQNIINGARQF